MFSNKTVFDFLKIAFVIAHSTDLVEMLHQYVIFLLGLHPLSQYTFRSITQWIELVLHISIKRETHMLQGQEMYKKRCYFIYLSLCECVFGIGNLLVIQTFPTCPQRYVDVYILDTKITD